MTFVCPHCGWVRTDANLTHDGIATLYRHTTPTIICGRCTWTTAWTYSIQTGCVLYIAYRIDKLWKVGVWADLPDMQQWRLMVTDV